MHGEPRKESTELPIGLVCMFNSSSSFHLLIHRQIKNNFINNKQHDYPLMRIKNTDSVNVNLLIFI